MRNCVKSLLFVCCVTAVIVAVLAVLAFMNNTAEITPTVLSAVPEDNQSLPAGDLDVAEDEAPTVTEQPDESTTVTEQPDEATPVAEQPDESPTESPTVTPTVTRLFRSSSYNYDLTTQVVGSRLTM